MSLFRFWDCLVPLLGWVLSWWDGAQSALSLLCDLCVLCG